MFFQGTTVVFGMAQVKLEDFNGVDQFIICSPISITRNEIIMFFQGTTLGFGMAQEKLADFNGGDASIVDCSAITVSKCGPIVGTIVRNSQSTF